MISPRFLRACCLAFWGLVIHAVGDDLPAAWPPPLRGVTNGTIRIEGRSLLAVPEAVVRLAATNVHAVPFDMAAEPPVLDLAFHGSLPDAALNGTGWTAWGDIGVADDGRVYSAIGDHGRDAEGASRAYLFEWDPAARRLRQVVDLNAITPRTRGEPTWAKVHAGIHQAADGWIYFSGTLNDGARAVHTNYHWSEAIPGGQLYRYDPRSGRAEVFANLPAPRCTATTQLDRERAVWWCNLEGHANALYGLCLTNREVVYRSPEGAVAFNRNFALARDGALYFNGPDGIWKYDPLARAIHPTRSVFPGPKGSMRASTHESRAGVLYGVTMGGQLFRYRPDRDALEMLGPDFLAGNYTTVCVLSPCEKYLYYLPGAHGGAFKIGTPVIQYDIAAGRRKVLAFLADAVADACDYVPAGTYGVKLSADGATLYVNFNGHAADAVRPKAMKANGFGFTAFAAIHIPASERP
jgi:sugar lactone lactonase YvrE